MDLSYGIICVSRHRKAVMLNWIDVPPPPPHFQASTPAGQINPGYYWVLKLENNELNRSSFASPGRKASVETA